MTYERSWPRLAPWVCLRLLAALSASATAASAQDLVPGAFLPAPVGFNVLTLGMVFSGGGVAFDPTLPITDATATIGGGFMGFGRTFNLAGRYANAGVALPLAAGHVEGLVFDQFQEASRRGLADTSIRFAINIYGAPAMTPREFASYRASTTVSAGLTVMAPTGQYDSDRYINLGTNRWAFKPAIAFTRTRGRWTFEGDLATLFFTTNPDYVGSPASTVADRRVAGPPHLYNPTRVLGGGRWKLLGRWARHDRRQEGGAEATELTGRSHACGAHPAATGPGGLQLRRVYAAWRRLPLRRPVVHVRLGGREVAAMTRFLPGLAVLSRYDRSWLRYDLVAGVSVAAVAVPIAIAYSQLAGVPPAHGLYASILPLVAYALLGSSRQLIMAPDAATCAIVAATVAPLAAQDPGRYVSLTMTLAMITGVFCIVAGMAGLGFLTNFLARPILTGYLNGIALSIISGQLGRLFGFSLEPAGFFRLIAAFISSVGRTHVLTLALGVGTFVLLRILKRVAPKVPGPLVAVAVGIGASSLFRSAITAWPCWGRFPRACRHR